MVLSLLCALVLPRAGALLPAAPQGAPHPITPIEILAPPKRWALVIGAGNYDSLGSLRYAPADARAFAKALVDDFKFRPESVVRLTDENEDTRPTVANIRKSLDGILSDPRLNKGDLFVFYFSGHGVGTASGDFLCPTDARSDNIAQVGLPVKEVVERFVKAGLKNVLVVADACRGGEKNNFGDELNRLSAEANIGVLLGCAPGSRSYQWSRAGHGYFTYYLLEALRKPELRQLGSGALWASEVGKWTSFQVAEATKASHDIPQVPAVECDDRRDIMMGAFLPATLESSLTEVLKTQTERLGVERKAATLADYASRLFEEDRYLEAAELLRVVEGLGRAEDSEQLLLGVSLSFIGRTSEASRVLDRLRKSTEGIYRHVAALVDERSPDPKGRVEAAQALVAAIKDDGAIIGFLGLVGTAGSNPYRAQLLRDVLESTVLKPKAKAFLEGDLAYELGDMAKAESLLRKSLSTFGLAPDDSYVRIKLAEVLKARTDYQGHLKLCDEGIKSGEQVAFWHLSKAGTLRFFLNRKDEAGVEIGKAVKLHLSPAQLVDCLAIGGVRSEPFADALRRQCDAYPRSWEAHVCRFLVDALVEGDLVADLPADNPAYRYADDVFVVAKGFELAYSGIWNDWVEEGGIPPELYRDLMILRSGRLINLVRRAGDDVELWWDATVNGIRAFRTPQLLKLYESKYGPALRAGRLSSTQRAQYCLVAFNGADFGLFERLAGEGLIGGDKANVAWLRALSLVIRGRDNEVAKLVPTLADPTADYDPMAAALRSYARAISSKPAEAAKLLAAAGVEDPSAKAIIGLGWLRCGRLDKAEPLLSESISMMNWAFQALHAHALARLGLAYRKAGKHAEADIVTFWLQMSQPGQPSLVGLQFGSTPTLAAFGGDSSFTGRQVDDETKITPIVARWSIDAKGNLTGTVAGHRLRGVTDSKGNFAGSASVNGVDWAATAKLAPRKTYESMAQFKEEAQVLVLLSPDAQRLIYALKPVLK